MVSQVVERSIASSILSRLISSWARSARPHDSRLVRRLRYHDFGPIAPAGGRPVFIVGTGRAGSTLARRVLMASGGIYVPPETYVFRQAYVEHLKARNSGAVRSHVWNATTAPYLHRREVPFTSTTLAIAREIWNPGDGSLGTILDSVYRAMAVEAGFAVDCDWGDKTPSYTFALPEIRRTFPLATVVALVRRLGPYVSSVLEYGIYNTPRRAVSRWFSAMRCLEADRSKNDGSLLVIDYDELAAKPADTFQLVFGAMDRAFDPSFLTTQVPDSVLGDVPQLPHHSRVRESAISASRRGDSSRLPRPVLAAGDQLFASLVKPDER